MCVLISEQKDNIFGFIFIIHSVKPVLQEKLFSLFISLFVYLPSPELIASGVIQLIENDNNNGAVMMVTKKRGIEFMKPRKSRKSKL